MVVTKPKGEWKYEDLLQLPDDGKRYEIIKGELYETPSPKWGHQRLINKLTRLPSAEVEVRLRGMVGVAPFDVLLGAEGDVVVQPDPFVVLPNRIEELGLADPESGKATGAPDLVVEVLSVSSTSERVCASTGW